MKKVGWRIDGNDIFIENMPGRVKPCLMIRPIMYELARKQMQEEMIGGDAK